MPRQRFSLQDDDQVLVGIEGQRTRLVSGGLFGVAPIDIECRRKPVVVVLCQRCLQGLGTVVVQHLGSERAFMTKPMSVAEASCSRTALEMGMPQGSAVSQL